jgi:hypothetical protein
MTATLIRKKLDFLHFIPIFEKSKRARTFPRAHPARHPSIVLYGDKICYHHINGEEKGALMRPSKNLPCLHCTTNRNVIGTGMETADAPLPA